LVEGVRPVGVVDLGVHGLSEQELLDEGIDLRLLRSRLAAVLRVSDLRDADVVGNRQPLVEESILGRNVEPFRCFARDLGSPCDDTLR
jgi:hypothetical protein